MMQPVVELLKKRTAYLLYRRYAKVSFCFGDPPGESSSSRANLVNCSAIYKVVSLDELAK